MAVRAPTENPSEFLNEKIKEADEQLAELNQRLEQRLADRQGLFWLLIGVTITLLLATLGTAWWLLPNAVFVSGIPGFVVDPRILVTALVLVYAGFSFRMVGTDEIGGADFFGRPLEEFGYGLKWVPRFVMRFRKEPGTSIQAQFPGDAGHIFWEDEKENLPSGMVRPIYAICAPGSDENDPLDRRLTIGITFYSRHQLREGQLYRLIRNISGIDPQKRDELLLTTTGGNVSDVMLEVLRQMRDTGERVLKEIAGKLSVANMNEYQPLVNELLFLRLAIKVAPWGITMLEGGIAYLNLGHEFNEILQKPAEAELERDAVIAAAEGKRRDLELEGQGRAAAEKAILRARGTGLKSIQDKTGVTGDIVITTDTARMLAESGNVIVAGGGGMADLMAMVAGGKKVTERDSNGN